MGQGLLIIEASRPHSDTSHSVGLLWTSDQPDAETSYLETHNTHKRKTSMPPAGFEPEIPTSERPQTHTLDRVATGTGNNNNNNNNNNNTRITHFLPKSGDKKEVRNYRPITCLTTTHKTVIGAIEESADMWKNRTYYQLSKTDVTLEIKGERIN